MKCYLVKQYAWNNTYCVFKEKPFKNNEAVPKWTIYTNPTMPNYGEIAYLDEADVVNFIGKTLTTNDILEVDLLLRI